MPLSIKESILILVSLVLIVGGAVLSIFWLDIFNQIITQKLILEKGSESYEAWKNPPLDLNLDIYLFNWTNPTNFTANEFEKPILQEIGPYRFREKTGKTRIRWHNSNSTVSYRKRSTYVFVPEESNGSLDDVIVTMNLVAISAANTARNWPFVNQKQVSMGLNLYNEQVYVIKEARELLFEGYQDDMIDMARHLANSPFGSFKIPYDRFGWFYSRNGSDEFGGHFNIHTGKDDINELGVVKNWNYQAYTKYYEDGCNHVRGSGGELFPPGQTKENSIAIFSGDLCRPLDLYFTEEQQIDGLNVYKYSSTERTLDSGQNYAENQCFADVDDALLPGVMNISACRYGAPVFVSMPHFYAADEAYLNYTEGLSPSADKHAFYISLDPGTGIPVEVAARLQINIHVQPFPNIALYQNAPTMFFPAIWFEQKVQIPSDVIADLKMAASMPTIGYICAGIVIAIGAILLAFTGYQWTKKQRQIQDVMGIEKNGGTHHISNGKFIGTTAERSPLMLAKSKAAFVSDGEVRRAPLSMPEDFDSINDITKNH